MVIKSVIVSSELFQGYTEFIELFDFTSIEHLCNFIKKKLMAHLCLLNLSILEEKVNNISFHIHDCKFIHELFEKDFIYICECSNA
jgi:hypothetical protein